jgi:hypothetical protein
MERSVIVLEMRDERWATEAGTNCLLSAYRKGTTLPFSLSNLA